MTTWNDIFHQPIIGVYWCFNLHQKEHESKTTMVNPMRITDNSLPTVSGCFTPHSVKFAEDVGSFKWRGQNLFTKIHNTTFFIEPYMRSLQGRSR